MQKKALIGSILVLVALIMILASLALPWYRVEEKVSGMGYTWEGHANLYLDHIEYSYLGFANEVDYDDEQNEGNNVINIFKSTQIIVYLGIIGCILGLIGAVLLTLDKLGKGIVVIFVLIALILLLIAPLYMMIALPNAFTEEAGQTGVPAPSDGYYKDFFGYEKEENYFATVETSWGGSIGWFLPIIAMILCIPAFFLVMTSSPVKRGALSAKPMKWDMFEEPSAVKSKEKPVEEKPYLTEDYFLRDHDAEDQLIEGDQEEGVQGPKVFQPLIPPPPPGFPAGQYKNTRFTCPDCEKIVIVNVPKRPLNVNCNSCGLKGIVE